MQDSLIIKDVLGGNTAAFEQLVLKYQRYLIYFIYNIVKDYIFAEDIVQEAFIKAYVNLRDLNDTNLFLAWIKKIASNIAFNSIKRDGRYVDSSDKDDEQFLISVSSDGDPENIVINREMGDYLLDSIGKLPEKMREVLMLKELDGLSYEEIASVLSVPVGTVRSRLFKARQIIKDKLVNKGLCI